MGKGKHRRGLMADIDNIDWKKHFEDFVDVSEQERLRAEKRRDYRDLKQWTDQEVAALEARGQAAIVFDQFSKKVDAIVGLEVQMRTDPKAYPVTKKHEKAAEAITDALRYVEQQTFFDDIASDVFEDKIVEGYGGSIIEYDPESGMIEINQIPWDRLYYDPYSRNKTFSDSKYFGITLWLDLDDAKQRFKDKADEIDNMLNNRAGDITFDDRPNDWIHYGRKRVRVNQEYYMSEKGWVEVFYAGDVILREPKPSSYLDCDGKPTCPIELQSDYIDRDNNRWGYTERLIDVQDEINHRRSKALFMLSSKSVLAERGAFGELSPDEVLNELRKGMSYLEYSQLGAGNPPIIDGQQELGASQIQFYQDAQQAMDSVGINPELTGQTDQAISGRAFMARQQGGMMELRRIFARHREWKTRVYRQIWARIKQFWNEEKWVRVTDDENAAKFVGINVPITRIEKMLEQQTRMMIDEVRDKAGDEVDDFVQMATQQNPLMGQVVEVRNDVAQIDMDIVVEDAPETYIQQQEQFETLAQLAGTRADPEMFKALVKLSQIPNKDDILEMFEPDKQQQAAIAQAQQQQQAIEQAVIQTDIENKQADTAKTKVDIMKVMSEINLNEAKAKDEMASAVERVGRVSALPFANQGGVR